MLGATGRTGRAFVEQALTRGHRVTAFVRSPRELPASVRALTGDPRSTGELRAALPDHDAVVSALGPVGRGPTTILGDSAHAVVAAMQSAGIRRLLVVSAAVLFEDAGWLAAALRRTLLRNVAEDSRELERAVRASDLDWTIVRPPRLTNRGLTQRYGVADDRMPPGRGSVSRADVAHLLLEELEQRAHVHHVVGMAS